MRFSDRAKGILGAVAPILGAAIGGPFGGIAAKAITSALGVEETDDVKAAARAVTQADPSQLLKLKQADHDFRLQMKELDLKEAQLHAQDRASARSREVETADNMTGILAIVISVGFFGVLGVIAFAEIAAAAMSALQIMLGALGTAWASVVAYYFGSSQGSSAKNAVIEKLSAKG